jgi:hypothetical protein
MADHAHVTSVEALESFRANLIVYLSKARPALEDVAADVQRMRSWLENDRRVLWERELRVRARKLEEAQATLFSARLSTFHEAGSLEQMMVHRAKHALDEADAKLRTVKQWNRVFDNRVDPLVKQMEKLHTVLTNDMVLAVAYLTQALNTLDKYSGTVPPPAATAPAPAAEAAQPEGKP